MDPTAHHQPVRRIPQGVGPDPPPAAAAAAAPCARRPERAILQSGLLREPTRRAAVARPAALGPQTSGPGKEALGGCGRRDNHYVIDSLAGRNVSDDYLMPGDERSLAPGSAEVGGGAA